MNIPNRLGCILILILLSIIFLTPSQDVARAGSENQISDSVLKYHNRFIVNSVLDKDGQLKNSVRGKLKLVYCTGALCTNNTYLKIKSFEHVDFK